MIVHGVRLLLSQPDEDYTKHECPGSAESEPDPAGPSIVRWVIWGSPEILCSELWILPNDIRLCRIYLLSVLDTPHSLAVDYVLPQHLQ